MIAIRGTLDLMDSCKECGKDCKQQFFPCYLCEGNDPECDCRTHPWAAQFVSYLPTNICPSKVGREYYDMIQQYFWLEKGILPNIGSLLDQPSTYVDIMPFVSSYINKCNEEIRKIKENNG